MSKETSEEISRLAAFYMKITDAKLITLIKESDDQGLKELIREIRSLAAFCLSRDETPQE